MLSHFAFPEMLVYREAQMLRGPRGHVNLAMAGWWVRVAKSEKNPSNGREDGNAQQKSVSYGASRFSTHCLYTVKELGRKSHLAGAAKHAILQPLRLHGETRLNRIL